MIRLSETRKLTAVLAGAISTTNPSVVVSYKDFGNEGSGAFHSELKATAMNGVAAVDICEAPPNSTIREIDFIAIRNNDTASVTVSVTYVDTTSPVMMKVTLATLEQLYYSAFSGWYVVTAAGHMKTSIASAAVDWANPGHIGATTPAAGTFTALAGSTLAITNTGTGAIGSITSTTTGSVNQAAMNLSRGDVANGYSQFGVGTTSTVAWQFGLRAGLSSWTLWDVVADTARITADTSGNVGIGVTPTTKFHVAGAYTALSAGFGAAYIQSTDALAADKGGTLAFGGVYTSGGGQTQYAGIAGLKENATDANVAGYLTLGTRPAGGSITTRVKISSTGNVVLGAEAALATTATDGFAYVPTCAGTPTGVPTAYTGKAAIVVDSTNNKLYFYAGAWRDAGP